MTPDTKSLKSSNTPLSDTSKTTQNFLMGLSAAIVVVFIWSGWLVISKVGVESKLTIYDIAALRYGISAIIAFPIVLYLKPWKDTPIHRIIVLAVLAGIPYVLLAYAGFTYAPAAHGGVFLNGALPAMTLVLAWLWLKERPRLQQVSGTVLIIIGALMAALDASEAAASEAWIGDLLFLTAGLSFSGYLIINRLWNVTIPLVLLSLSVVSGFIYIPIWYIFLPSALVEAAHSQILLQAAYQGLLPNLVGLGLISIAVRHAGASATAAIISAVPGLGAILGLVLLGEILGPMTWVGIFIVTIGILLTAIRRRTS
jgi:drug/metabolite transporter (DMT)-like permease